MVERDGRKIRAMFGAIAPTYDLLNHLLSFSMDRRWRRLTREHLQARVESCRRALDLCSGTGDLALEMSSLGRVIACDFSGPMLARGMSKAGARSTPNPVFFVQGDALDLPFSPAAFQVATIAFGLRNLEDYERGLREVVRVLEPGGFLAVLEFTLPDSRIFGTVYRLYFEHVLPLVGGLISGRTSSYRYLPASVREFPGSEELERLFRRAGFNSPASLKLSGGIAAIYIAQKRQDW